jgi:aquaporin Z
LASTRPAAHRALAVGAHARGEAGRALERRLAVEFIGTFFLIFTVGAATSRTGAGALAPLAVGAVLMALIFAGGHVSGAHYNPAVTVAVAIRGKIKPREALAYIVVQLLAAGSAGVLARAVNGAAVAAAPAAIWKILVVEFLFTLALAYVMLNVATSAETRDNSFYGLAIGFTVVAGALAVGGISGGAFNPAVALGASIIGLLAWGHIWIYALANMFGGAAAAAAYLYVNTGGNAFFMPPPEAAAHELLELEIKSG